MPKEIYLAPEHVLGCPETADDKHWCEDNMFEDCPECGAKVELYEFKKFVE